MLFSVCVVLLVTMWQASSQAPGDEDQRCLNERAFANDVYPPFTRMLMDSRNYEELISGSGPHWQQLDVDRTGFGWTSTLGGLCAYMARVCDFRESTSQDNWVFTQYISYLEARQVLVNISAGFTECRLAQSPRCNQLYVDVYRYERNGRNDAAARTTSNYQLVRRIQQPNGFAQRTYQTSFTFNPSGNTNGFYIGVRGTGTCINIQRLQIYYNEFMPIVDPPVKCPRTGLPPQGTTASVTCSCSANSVATSDLQLTCSSDGTCTGNPTCQCQRGYGLQEERCGAPPSSAQNVNPIVRRNTTVVVGWNPPLSDGGRNDTYFVVKYREVVRLGPFITAGQTNESSFTVRGLKPVTQYRIRIIAENGVSDQEPGSQGERTTEIVVSTTEGKSGPPRRVHIVDNRVVVWQKPDAPNGNITGYEVGISTTPEPTPDLITIVGRINDAEQNFFVINSDDESASVAYVQVRAINSVGSGNWSTAVQFVITSPTTAPPVTCPPVPCPTSLTTTLPLPPAQVGRVNVFYDKDKETKLVVWDKPLREVTMYSVRISYNDGSSGQRINQYRSSKNQWLELGLINLPTQRPLWIEVRARGSAGAAPWSSRVELCVDEQKAN